MRASGRERPATGCRCSRRCVQSGGRCGAPDPNRFAETNELRNALRDEHKNGQWAQAGSANGGHYSPFKELVRKLQAAAIERPGIKLKDFVGNVDHHFSSDQAAERTLRKALNSGSIKGFELRQPSRVYEVGVKRYTMRNET